MESAGCRDCRVIRNWNYPGRNGKRPHSDQSDNYSCDASSPNRQKYFRLFQDILNSWLIFCFVVLKLLKMARGIRALLDTVRFCFQKRLEFFAEIQSFAGFSSFTTSHQFGNVILPAVLYILDLGCGTIWSIG